MIPEPWTFALLALAAYRCWWLLSRDAILNRWRERAFGRWPGILEEFVGCPWCSGFYVSLGVYAAWIWQPKWTLVVAVPSAISVCVGTLAMVLFKLSEDSASADVGSEQS